MRPFIAASFFVAVLAANAPGYACAQGGEVSANPGDSSRTEVQPGNKSQNIDHWIVIYQENWSFDGLYGKFPGADGLNHAAAAANQVDKQGKPLRTLPSPSTDPNIPPGLPVGPYDLSRYVPAESTTKT